jgi:HK97 family phage major capsid protein
MSPAKKLRQQRGEIVEQARAMLDTNPNLSAADQKKFEALMGQADAMKSQIDRLERVGDLEHELAQPMARRRAGREPTERDTMPGTVWKDQRTGDAIPVLNKGQSFASAVGAGVERGPSLGDLVRGAAIPGSASIEVRNALGESTGPGGGFTVGEGLSATIIDRLRARAVCFEAGAQTVPMATSRLNIARLAADPAASWKAENASVNEGAPAFERISLDARTLTTVVRFSRELAEDASNFNAILTGAITKAFALELDRAALFGDATAGQPIGLNNLGISEVNIGADGGHLAGYDDLIDAVYLLENANAAVPSAAVMSPRSKKTYNKSKSGEGEYLIRPAAIETLPFLTTTSVPNNQTHGSATTCSTIFVGDFTQMLIGVRTELTLQILQERYADTLQYGLLAYLRADVHVQHAESFAKITGILP